MTDWYQKNKKLQHSNNDDNYCHYECNFALTKYVNVKLSYVAVVSKCACNVQFWRCLHFWRAFVWFGHSVASPQLLHHFPVDVHWVWDVT